MKTIEELTARAGFIGDNLDNTVFGTTYKKALENLVKIVLEEVENVPEILDRKDVYIVEVNSDLTEGRGYQYPKYVCEKQTTAIRLAKKADVQGCDGKVYKKEAVRIGNTWLMPGNLISPSKEDLEEEKRLAHELFIANKKQQVLDKAKSLGLSEEELKILAG